MTLNAILKEMKDVPADRLEELYQLVHSMTAEARSSAHIRKKILSFGGSFSAMSRKDYEELTSYLKETRTNLFSRNKA